MARLNQMTSLTMTDLILLSALGLSILASVLASGSRNPTKSTINAAPAQSVGPLSTSLVDITEASTTESEILPSSVVEGSSYPSTLPDFSAIKDVRRKKQAFFSYLLPKIRHENDKIRANRRLLLVIRDELRTGETLGDDDIRFISTLKARYRLKHQADLRSSVNDLLIRVDVVPESLVLAQAASESGWGTSRFATQANNLFGVWCFREGCGLIPMRRDVGLTHEVTKYDSVQHSIVDYIYTINTHSAYIGLRNIRATTRSEKQHFDGLALAEGLLRYSTRGIDYVREIQQLIRVNNLQKYTLPIKV